MGICARSAFFQHTLNVLLTCRRHTSVTWYVIFLQFGLPLVSATGKAENFFVRFQNALLDYPEVLRRCWDLTETEPRYYDLR